MQEEGHGRVGRDCPERGLPTPAPGNKHGPALVLLPLLSWLPAEGF